MSTRRCRDERMTKDRPKLLRRWFRFSLGNLLLLLALVATAAGLAAAIPAVIGYNHFMAKLRSMDSLIDEFIADFIHRLQGRRR